MIGSFAGVGNSVRHATTSQSEAKIGADTSAAGLRNNNGSPRGGRLSEDQVTHVKNLATTDQRQSHLQDYHQSRYDSATKHALKLRGMQAKATTPEARERIKASLDAALKQRIQARKAMESIPQRRDRLTAMADQVLANPHIPQRGLTA